MRPVVTGAGFGGVATFNESSLANKAKSLRGWGRRSSQYGETEDFERRFDCRVDGIDYDDKYVFDDLGFNFIPSEISAAFALVQLQNLRENVEQRWQNFQYLTTFLPTTRPLVLSKAMTVFTQVGSLIQYCSKTSSPDREKNCKFF